MNDITYINDKQTDEQTDIQIINEDDELTIPETSLAMNSNKKQKITKLDKKKPLTSSVWNHCKRTNHPSDPTLKIATCQYKFTSGKNAGEICSHIIETKGPTGNIHAHLNSHGITNSSNPSITSIVKPPTQKTLDSIVMHNPIKQKELIQLLVMWIIEDQQPLYILQNRAFKRFINITFDLWTAQSGKGYLGITCTFVDESFHLQEVVLACKRLEYPHTSEVIKESLLSIFATWGVEHKVFAYTTDNGSNMVKLSRIIPSERLINAQKTLKNYNKELEENDQYLQLISDVETCWNSSYLAWKCLIQIQDLITMMKVTLTYENQDADTKKDGRRLKEIDLSTDEWDTIKKLLKILEPFAKATQYLGGGKYVSVSFIYPIIYDLKKQFQPFATDMDLNTTNDAFEDETIPEDDNEEVIEINTSQRRIKVRYPQDCSGLIQKIKGSPYDALNHYWKVDETEIMIATILDPQTKTMQFGDDNLYEKTKEELTFQYNLFKSANSDDEQPESSSSHANLNQTHKQNYISGLFKKNADSEGELEEYFNHTQIDWDANQFEWWDMYKSKFPILSNLT
nr:11696_t:CDS:2 [Entrophospora candida]